MDGEKVKCVECGFLALQRISDRQAVEADEKYRTQLEPPREYEVAEYDTAPLCFVGKFNLWEEIAKLKSENWLGNIEAIIHKERLCDGYTNWLRGFTPKEHFEIMDRTEWRKWQAGESRKNRNWRIIEAITFFVIACLFVLLGYLLGN